MRLGDFVAAIRFAASWLRRQRLDLILALLVLAAGSWAFIELADEVREGDTQALDETILRLLRRGEDFSQPAGPAWLQQAARDITALGSPALLVIFTLAAAGFLALVSDYSAIALVLGATWGGQLVCLALKHGIDRTRPDIVPHWDKIVTASFPSGHAMMSAIVYLTLAAILANFVQSRKLKTFLIGFAALLTFLVGISRLILGVHYPTDVLAGWTAGLVWALLCGLLASIYKRRFAKNRLSLKAVPD